MTPLWAPSPARAASGSQPPYSCWKSRPYLDPQAYFIPPIVHAALNRSLSSRPTGLAPRRLGTPPPLLFTLKSISFFSISRTRLHRRRDLVGREIRRLDRIHIVVQPVGLTVELPSTTHGLASARTWTGRLPGLTLLGHPGSPETTPGTIVYLIALLDHNLIVVRPRIPPPCLSLIPHSAVCDRCGTPVLHQILSLNNTLS